MNCYTPYILGTHGSHTLLTRKDFQSFLLVPSLRFGSPSNRFSFIEPDGPQMKKPTSSCGHFGKGFLEIGNDRSDRIRGCNC